LGGEILKDIFNEIIISQAVYNEIKAKESYGYKEVDYSITSKNFVIILTKIV